MWNSIAFAVALSITAASGSLSRSEVDWPLSAQDSVSEESTLDEMYRALASRRKLQMSRLHAYAREGEFPRNADFPGRLVPYFVDRRGTACAVGHLMRLDGESAVVDRIAAHSNHIRIEDVHGGPLAAWILDSGFLQNECALIQPSYAKIEDYRRGRPWQNDAQRLREHFARVEDVLSAQSEASLGKALIAKVDAKLRSDADSPALSIASLASALTSEEPNVRITAAYAIARLSSKKLTRTERIDALLFNLDDRNPAVRFWTAVALEKVGSASERGAVELHRLTLPVFVETFRGTDPELRLPALIQLASIAPEAIGTNRQLRIVPEIRLTLVEACSDENREIRELAREVMSSWRWQRTAYESRRMRRHYLADSFELESIAAEAATVGEEFVDPPASIQNLNRNRLLYDAEESNIYQLPIATETSMPIESTKAGAQQRIESYFHNTYAQHLAEGEGPFWKGEAVQQDKSGLYYLVSVKWSDRGTKLIYVVPRPSMLLEANSPPHSWFAKEHSTEQYKWPASPPMAIKPKPEVRIVLGSEARNDRDRFTEACDLFGYFIAHHSFVVLDREVTESTEQLKWSGRFANLRRNQTRFFEQGGGGSSSIGGGGWDIYRLSIGCDRESGKVSLAAEPIRFEHVPLAKKLLEPAWVTEELRLMGWRPLESITFFGTMLLPSEYHDAIERFDPANSRSTRDMLYRRWHFEKHLPNPCLVLGLLYDQSDRQADAKQLMARAASEGSHDPTTLADVARWELSHDEPELARKHAKMALELWPNHPQARKVIQAEELQEEAVH